MRRRHAAAFTMLDVFFLMMILTVVLIPIAGMFPLGHVAVQRGKSVAAASFVAQQQITQLRLAFPTGLINYVNDPQVTTSQVTLDNVVYNVTTQLWTVETRRWVTNGVTTTECYIADASITVTYPQGMPVTYSTRLYADANPMQQQ